MARINSDARTIVGLVAAIATAPFIVAVTAGYLMFGGDIPGSLELAGVAVVLASPLSAMVAFAIGVPAILLAHRLRTRSVWYYAACGLVAGRVGVWASPGKVTEPRDIAIYVVAGLAASLVYWLIAERGRAKDPDADF